MPLVQGMTVIILAALPGAILGILPNALLGDIAAYDAEEKGESNAGMYFAARTFTMKVGTAVAALLFPTFLNLGNTSENPFGIRAATFTGFLICIAAAALFTTFPNSHVKRDMNTRPNINSKNKNIPEPSIANNH